MFTMDNPYLSAELYRPLLGELLPSATEELIVESIVHAVLQPFTIGAMFIQVCPLVDFTAPRVVVRCDEVTCVALWWLSTHHVTIGAYCLHN